MWGRGARDASRTEDAPSRGCRPLAASRGLLPTGQRGMSLRPMPDPTGTAILSSGSGRRGRPSPSTPRSRYKARFGSAASPTGHRTNMSRPRRRARPFPVRRLAGRFESRSKRWSTGWPARRAHTGVTTPHVRAPSALVGEANREPTEGSPRRPLMPICPGRCRLLSPCVSDK